MSEVAMRCGLVTGASGAIGRRLCTDLSAAGWRVLATGRRAAAHGPWARFVPADFEDSAAVNTVSAALQSERVDVVWHLAGKAHALGELRQGTLHALELARRLGARRFVFASSVKAMGEGGYDVLDESSPCMPATPYGRSKLEAEQAVAAQRDLEWVILRFCMVYGGEDRGNMGRMVSAIRRRRFPPFPECGNRRSFVFLEDAVAACRAVAESPTAPGEKFIVTDGHLYSTHQLYLTIRTALGRGRPLFVPSLGWFRIAARVGDVLGRLAGVRMPLDTDTLRKLSESSAYSSAKLTRMVGFEPQWPLRRGIDVVVRGGLDVGARTASPLPVQRD
jgi:nucleoside-diphosphate-sugar epimerase